MKYGEDILFLAQFRMICKSTLLYDTSLYFYFQRSESVMHKIDAQQHGICLLKLASFYKKESLNFRNSTEIKKRMSNAYIRAMQAFCADLCMYCKTVMSVKRILKKLKENKLYPFGVDWGNFKIDRRQSRKNDLMNWFFGLLSFEPYFWTCWLLCYVIRVQKTESVLDIVINDEILNKL